MRLYHVTHRPYSVLRSGLDPAYSQGRMSVVWLCDLERLPWALAHVAEHHGLPPERMSVIGVRVRAWDVVRRRPGVYVSHRRIHKSRLWVATIAS